jgi:serine/threonine protein kinase
MHENTAKHEERLGSMVGGRWVLERLLGWGSTAAVYEARDASGTRRAIKVLNAALCSNETVVHRFLREAYISNAVQHRAMVRVHGDGISNESVYLVLDLLDGETLEERRLRGGGKLPLAEVVPLADELMSTLAAVHAVGVIHRDLKPQNVFLTRSEELKLLDFGTARVFEPEGKGRSLSVEGLVIGSPSFMSPEQARGARSSIDAQSDVWSLGATLFTVLSGEYVHAGRDAHQRLLAGATKAARSFATVAPDVDPRIVATIDRALAFEKKDRWPDMDSMRRAFAASL